MVELRKAWLLVGSPTSDHLYVTVWCRLQGAMLSASLTVALSWVAMPSPGWGGLAASASTEGL